VVPKCACSTIGQIMFYSDHGRFFEGDIHDATADLHKWAIDASVLSLTLPTCFREFRRVCRGRVVLG
jgi:hypothetical protein